MFKLTRFAALGLASALGALAFPSGAAMSLFDPTQPVEDLGLGLDGSGLPEPQLPSLQTLYSSGVVFYVNPAAVDAGGRVLYVSGPIGGAVTVDRMAGGTDGAKVKAGPYVQATYAESTDSQNDTWNSFAMSVGSNVWMVVAADPENLDHYAIVGWYVWPTGGSIGEENLDPWGSMCAVLACAWAS